MVPGFEIEEGVEVPSALRQAEAPWVYIPEGRHAQPPPVRQRSPDPLVLPSARHEPVGIVDARAEVVEGTGRAGAEEEHAAERGYAELADIDACEQSGFDAHLRALAGFEHEAVRAGDGRAVEQCMNDEGVGIGLGTDEPELTKVGELLRSVGRDVHRQSPRGQPVHLTGSDEPEVRGPLKDDDLVHAPGRVQREVNAEARVPQRTRCGESVPQLCRRSLVGEETRVEAERPSGLVHDVDPHRLVEEEARVKELYLEAARVLPERGVRAEADRAVRVVVELRQGAWEFVGRCAIRLARELARSALDERGDPIPGKTLHRRRKCVGPVVEEFGAGAVRVGSDPGTG